MTKPLVDYLPYPILSAWQEKVPGPWTLEVDASWDDDIAPGETVQVKIDLQCLWRMDRLVIPEGVARSFAVRVGVAVTGDHMRAGIEEFVALENEALREHPAVEYASGFKTSALEPGVAQVFYIRNVTEYPRRFSAYAVGRVML